jgi:hypothetical protein
MIAPQWSRSVKSGVTRRAGRDDDAGGSAAMEPLGEERSDGLQHAQIPDAGHAAMEPLGEERSDECSTVLDG